MGESESNQDEDLREHEEDESGEDELPGEASVDDSGPASEDDPSDDAPAEADAPDDDAAPDMDGAARAPQASRRQFLDTAIVGGTAVVGVASGYPALRFLEPAEGATATSATVARVGDFPTGTSKSARLGETPILVVRDTEGAFRAYVAVCPHLQCVVRFAAEAKEIACACHGGRFALSGAPKGGPPKQPLEVLRVNVIGEDVVVTRA